MQLGSERQDADGLIREGGFASNTELRFDGTECTWGSFVGEATKPDGRGISLQSVAYIPSDCRCFFL